MTSRSKTNSTKKPIYDWIYLARIIGSLAVVGLHLNTFIAASWLRWSLIASTIWAVPVFIMISGALMPKSLSRRLLRLLPLIFIWLPAYYIYSHQNQVFDFWQMLTKIFIYGEVGHLYFFLILVELAVITPIINKYILNLAGFKMVGLIGALALLGVFWNNRSPYAITFFIPYLSYYLLGNYLNQFKISTQVLLASKIGFGLSIISLLIAIWLFDGHGFLFRHSNPLIFTLAATGFMWLKATKFQFSKVKFVSNLTLGVYILHPILIDLVLNGQTQIPNSWLIPLTLLIFTACATITFLLKKNPLTARLGMV